MSRFFKNSSGFQPQNLADEKITINKGWQDITSPKPDTEQQFTPGSEIAEKIEQSKGPSPPEQPFPPPPPLPPDRSVLQKTDSDEPQGTVETEDQQPQEITIPENYISIEEFDKIKSETHQQGYREGFLAGQQEATQRQEADYASATKAMISICTQLETCRDTIINNSSKELQDFAVAIAEKIIRYSLEQNDQTIIATIEEALQRSIKSSEFYIYVNPEDYAVVSKKSEELIAGVNGLNNIVIKKDPKIERGGTRVESENCTVDATVASQFELIRAEVEKRMG